MRRTTGSRTTRSGALKEGTSHLRIAPSKISNQKYNQINRRRVRRSGDSDVSHAPASNAAWKLASAAGELSSIIMTYTPVIARERKYQTVRLRRPSRFSERFRSSVHGNAARNVG